MAQSDPSGISGEIMRELYGAQSDFAKAINRQVFPGGEYVPPPPLPFFKRVRGTVRWKVQEARESIARRIAPWLYDHDY